MKILRPIAYVACCCFLLLLSTKAGATIIIAEGLVGGSGDVENVLLTGGLTGATTGLTVTGETNDTHEYVDFTGNEMLKIEAGGQARIEAVDGAFNYMEIELQDQTMGFAKIQFNLDALIDGTVYLSMKDQFGTYFNQSFSLDGSGQNFFTAYSNDNQVIVMARIVSTVEVQALTDIQQVRLGPTRRTAPVPEPATILLFGSGLVGLAGFGRKKFKK